MDEANQRLPKTLVELQGLPAGAVMTEAHRLARNAIKAQWQAQGLKVPYIPYSELATAARDYLDTHQAELVGQAQGTLMRKGFRCADVTIEMEGT